MDDFEFLDNQFRRLNEARDLRAHDEAQSKKDKNIMNIKISPFATTEYMIQGTIRDYLATLNTRTCP